MNGRADNEEAGAASYFEEEVSVSLPPEDVTQAQVLEESMAKPERREGELLANRYRLERMIAKGGMGRVYLATQLPLERKVAVKVLTAKPDDEEFRKRFFLEASTCAKLVHRHIVTVHDYGEAEDGELFMAMEFLDGEPLSRVISQQIRVGSERVAQIGLQVCRALRTAHKTGVVHRDLKPGNVMLIRDEDHDGTDFVKVLDFGLVKVFEKDDEPSANAELTRSGTWLGSPRYMAPEQIRCKPVDPRTDIYSLGIIMFNMVAGRPPFVGANSVEILEQHLRDAPPTFDDVMPGVPYAPELEVVIRRCMEKRPEDRYQSMDELIADLKAAYRLMTGVSVHTESQLSGFSDAGRNTIPPDLSLPPDFSIPPELSNPSGLIAAPPPPLPTPTPVPAAFPSSVPDLEPEPSFMAKRPPNRVAIAIVLLVVLSVAGYAAARMIRSEDKTPIAVKPAPPESPKPASDVQVRLTTSPAGATVRADGRALGVTPLVHHIDRSAIGQTKSFVLELEGFETQTLTTQVEQRNVDLHAALVPRARTKAIVPNPPVDEDEEIVPDEPTRTRRVRKKKKSRDSASEDATTASADVVPDDVAATPPAVEDDVSLDVDDGDSIVVDDQASNVVEEDSVPIVD